MVGLKVESIKKIVADTKVYDFEVEGAHHYLLGGGVVSHNSYIPMKKMGGGCLVSGTKIKTPIGDIPIERIGIGDYVSTVFGDKPVLKTYQFEDKSVYEVEFENGHNIKCSADHKFLIGGKWISVSDLVSANSNTTNLNIEVADVNGDINVFKQQIQENLLRADE